MKIFPISANETKPLPYAEDEDNHIYKYVPTESNDGKRSNSKRSKVNPSPVYNPFNISRCKNFAQRNRRRNVSSCISRKASNNSIGSLRLESEFSFNYPSNNNSDSSDLESLPDLSSSDDTTPLSSPVNHLRTKHVFLPDVLDKPKSLLNELQEVNKKPSIFEIPELVYKIVSYAEEERIPQENTPVYRRPLSYNHAFLIHGDREQAQRIMVEETQENSVNQKPGLLYNLLQVNQLFNQVSKERLYSKIYFDDEIKFIKFINHLISSKPAVKIKPKLFVLHKLYSVKQKTLEVLKKYIDFSHCEWIEIYMCPKLYPPKEMLANSQLKKLVITGSKVIDDEFLIRVSQNCYHLNTLDIRACELVSDGGIYHIASKCTELTNVNFGRKNKGNLITDTSINKLIKNNCQLNTVGLAGCYITDRTIWDLAIYCNESLNRLSLNNCQFITNQSIPIILSSHFYWNNLSVLELRFVPQLSQFQSLIEFKRRQEYKGISILIELCETLMIRWRQEELEMDKIISEQIFQDILAWVNESDDEDGSYQALLQLRSN